MNPAICDRDCGGSNLAGGEMRLATAKFLTPSPGRAPDIVPQHDPAYLVQSRC
jgi:hypothetical protein